MQAAIFVEAHITRASGGVWPFPPKTVSRKGDTDKQEEKRRRASSPCLCGRGLCTIETDDLFIF
ncbi:hypothetical protein KSZ_54100 [Dictyobacter formicarum]|uniref:Uncharacterized protein n=1 Tax=Dictyobacter formicarum TaxID=2778368 RepID=A0ABQ3VMG5_9CHLR|nr:hypothetical protein KSZ_54100 [Dictyobacter formicarum]